MSLLTCDKFLLTICLYLGMWLVTFFYATFFLVAVGFLTWLLFLEPVKICCFLFENSSYPFLSAVFCMFWVLALLRTYSWVKKVKLVKEVINFWGLVSYFLRLRKNP